MIESVGASLDQELLDDALRHPDEALRMMRLSILSRSLGDMDMSIERANSDPAVKRAGGWLVSGQRRGEGEVGKKEDNVFERLYPDIDVVFM